MVVGDAARERITVLPTVLYTPQWDAVTTDNGVDYPREYAPYAAYLTALIGRYGPKGSFWRDNPGDPQDADPVLADLERAEPRLLLEAAVRLQLRVVPQGGPRRGQEGRPGRPGGARRAHQHRLDVAGPGLQGQGRQEPVRRRRGQRLHQDPGQRHRVHALRPPRHVALRRRRQAADRHRDQLAVGQGQDQRQASTSSPPRPGRRATSPRCCRSSASSASRCI